jgi:hypothetical protein
MLQTEKPHDLVSVERELRRNEMNLSLVEAAEDSDYAIIKE